MISLLPIGKREAGQADATHFSEVRRRDSTLPLFCARRDGVRVLYPAVVPDSDPFRGAKLEHSEGTTKLAYRSWACAGIARSAAGRAPRRRAARELRVAPATDVVGLPIGDRTPSGLAQDWQGGAVAGLSLRIG